MSATKHHSRFARLKANPALKLLEANNIFKIISIIESLFETEKDLPYDQAIQQIEHILAEWRRSGIWEHSPSSSALIRDWIKNGWLSETGENDCLSKSHAFEVTSRFLQSLDVSPAKGTASHLKVVQDICQRLAIDLSENRQIKRRMIQSQIKELESQLQAIDDGRINPLSEQEQKERVTELVLQAKELTHDFRWLEEQIRELDKTTRINMINNEDSRGKVLAELLKNESTIFESENGLAFNAFYDLLADLNSKNEMQSQIRSIIESKANKFVSHSDLVFLKKLYRVLDKECQRIKKIRRRTTESLRGFVQSDAFTENRTISRLINEIKRLAIDSQEGSIKLTTPVFTAKTKIGSDKTVTLGSLKLRHPTEIINISNIPCHEADNEIPELMHEAMNTVDLKALYKDLQQRVRDIGACTLSYVLDGKYLEHGLEDVIGYIRIVDSIGATEHEGSEEIQIFEEDNISLKIKIPKYYISKTHVTLEPEDFAL